VKGREQSGLAEWFRDVHRSVASILEGLGVTMSWMFRRPITIQYPDKIDKPVQEMLPEGYRGVLEVDVRLCTGCLLCSKTCPITCIDLEVSKNEAGGRDITRFDIDISRCMYCGLCSEACASGALAHTPEFEASSPDIRQLNLHFVTAPVPVAKAKAEDTPERAKPGSIVKHLIPGFGRRKP
jgi:formate hydrogenlyase subunit 6/NADH:ubiquinone oxidoreductase subunit I